MSGSKDHSTTADRARDADAASSSTTRATTGMLNLSAELQVNIAQYVEPADIRNFRLVSREIRAASEDRFLEVFFKTRRHILTKSSLDNLVVVTSRPHLRKAIKSVHFYLASTEEEGIEFARKYRTGYTKHNRAIADRLVSQWQAERKALAEKRGLRLLHEALRNLAKSDNSTSIGLDWAGSKSPYPYGLQTLEKAVGTNCRKGPFIGEELVDSYEVQIMLVESLTTCGMAPLSLSVPSPFPYNGIQWCNSPEFSHSFSRLQKLELGSHGSTDFGWEHPNELTHETEALVKACCATLSDLTIYLTSWPFDLEILSDHKLRNLSITLDDSIGPNTQQDIMNTLKTQRETLRSLTIQSVDHRPSELSCLLNWVPENLLLDEFVFRLFSHGIFPWDRDSIVWKIDEKFEGKEDIAESFEEILELDTFW